MKRCLAFVLCICLLGALSGCNRTKYHYVSQSGINFNYNNISSGANVWFDNDGIYYPSTDLLISSICSIDASGTHRLTMADYVISLQKHGNSLFWVEYGTKTGEYKLMKYDLDTRKKSSVVAFVCDDVYEFYYAQEYIYALTTVSTKYSFQYNAVAICVETEEVVKIEEDVFACGVYGGSLYYLVASGGEMRAYRYDVSNAEQILLGSFEPDIGISEYCYNWVNFTSDSVVFYSDLNGASKIHRYNYVTDQYSFQNVDGYIYTLVAYEDRAFALVGDDGYEESEEFEENNASLLYVELESLSIQQIGEGIYSYADLFVTSDYDLYLSDSFNEEYYHYCADGTKEEIVLPIK